MLVAEEELAIQVAQINGIQIHDVDFAETVEDEVLEQLAANATSANHQDARLQKVRRFRGRRDSRPAHLLDMREERAAEALLRERIACHVGDWVRLWERVGACERSAGGGGLWRTGRGG